MAAAAVLCSCDPVSDSSVLDPVNSTQEQLEGVTFKVYKDEACTEEAGPAEGNWVKFWTSPSMTVTVYNFDKAGNENILAYGTAGVFKLSPKRGASNDQVLNIRTINSDNTVLETTKTVNVWVKSDLEPELKLLLGEAGVKRWMWDYDAVGNNTCWGNGGASSGEDYTSPRTVGGHWWGVSTPEGLLDQLQHSNTGNATGEEESGAYMILDEDGGICSYKADGTPIPGRKGSFKIENYDPFRSSGWEIGKLVTSDPAVLFPFSINENGKTVTEFDIMYLDQNFMTLVYTKGNGAGSWGEITHWMFKNCSPSTEILEGIDGRKWGWATDNDADGNRFEVWGNAGNSGNGAGFNATAVDGKWWGVKTGSELEGQLNHSGGVNYGDASDDAYMIFDNGKVASYKADGTEIRSGKYELEIYPDGRAGNWELGKLKTNAVLFPWSINEGGKQVDEFDVMYMDASHMTLVYTKGNGAGSWGEITFWRFGSK